MQDGVHSSTTGAIARSWWTPNLLLVVCLSIILLLFDASLLNFMCCGLLHILFVKLYVSLSFFFCLMRVSFVFVFNVGIFVIFVPVDQCGV